MTPRRIRPCRNCARLTLHRLCSVCFDEMRSVNLARGITTRPAHQLLPTIATIPQPKKDNHD